MNRYILFFCFLIAGLSITLAQPLNRSTARTNLSIAESRYDSMDYYNSLEYYTKYLDDNKKDLPTQAKIADLNFILRDYNKAANFYSKVLNKDKKGEYSQLRFNYAKALKMNENYEDAILQFSEFANSTTDPVLKKMAEIEIKGCQMAPKMEQNSRLTVTNLGKAINKATTEASPYITPDGTQLFYASFNSDSAVALDGKNTDYFLKIYSSKKDGDKWAPGELMNDQINREGYSTGNATFSRDGKRMYFNRAVLKGNVLSESKIYVATLGPDGWGAPKEVAGVNGDFQARHPMTGELFGKEVLFFSSNMAGGHGGYDIYYATYKADDVYTDPVNLGTAINSIGDEYTPFYKDGKLYFSSDSYPGLGGLDIFYSTWTGTGWTAPVNMGKGYNTSVDDWYFTIDDAGYNGFLVSNRPGGRSLKSKTCCDDIYSFNIEKFKATVNTLVFDASSGKVVQQYNAQLIEMTGDKMGVTESKNSGKTNTVDFPLVLEKSYAMIINKDGYYPDTIKGINTVALAKDEAFKYKINLKPKEPEYEIYSTEEAIRLNNIYYDYNDDKILPSAEGDLTLIYDLMKQYPDMVIELSSHTDARGDDDYNMKLSQRRANSAKNWLVKKGIAGDKIQAVGYGETKILNKCVNDIECTDDEHRFNRRTEFKIVSGPTSIKIEKKRLKGSKEEGVIINKTGDMPKVTPKEEPKSDSKGTTAASEKEPKLKPTKSYSGPSLLRFDPTAHNYGVIPYKDKRSFTYQFTNVSDQDVEIDLCSACECMTLDWTKGVIKPGGKGTIKAVLDTTPKSKGEDVDDSINVMLNTVGDKSVPFIYTVGYKAKVK